MMTATIPPIRVLLVDDDPPALSAMRYLLTPRAHMAVATATGPNDALDLVDATTFDVVVAMSRCRVGAFR